MPRKILTGIVDDIEVFHSSGRSNSRRCTYTPAKMTMFGFVENGDRVFLEDRTNLSTGNVQEKIQDYEEVGVFRYIDKKIKYTMRQSRKYGPVGKFVGFVKSE